MIFLRKFFRSFSLPAKNTYLLGACFVGFALVVSVTYSFWRSNGFREIPYYSVYQVQTREGNLVGVHLSLGYDAAPYQMHYVEHLAWLNSIGGQDGQADRDTNAWTTNLAVGYWLSGKPEELPDMLRTILGVFKPVVLQRDFAEQEKAILQREYDLRVGDNINGQVYARMTAYLYQGNAIAASPLGTPEQIAALDYDQARALHDQTHLPENATFVVVGNVSERQLQRALEAAGLGGKPDQLVEIAPPPFVLAAPETRIFTFAKPEAAPRMIWRKVVTLDQPVDFDLLETQSALLRDILDTNLPGGLAGPLRFDSFITRSFDVEVFPLDERHIELQFFAAPDQNVSFADLRGAFESALSASAQGVPPDTWQRVRDRFKTYWPDWNDETTVGTWMASYILDRVQALRPPLSEAELQGLDAQLAREDINKLLKALVGSGRTAIAFVGKDTE